jgi:3-oxoacyl-[acyl-carrier-protein] synthase-3
MAKDEYLSEMGLFKNHQSLLQRSYELLRSQPKRVGIKSAGYSLPPNVRHNDDPIFEQIIRDKNAQGFAEADLFTGMKERRYLKDGELLETLMIIAASQAIHRANLEPRDIDRLYGYASVPEFYTPNSLYMVHRWLGLSEYALVIPINNEFSTFLLGVMEACNAIIAGSSRRSLVVCGTNWTKFMDYTQGHALSVGDGAGAAVVSEGADFVLLDYATQTLSGQYGAMTMQVRDSFQPTYKITEDEGVQSFQVSAMQGIPDMVNALLKRHGLTGNDIALITHQASRVLMDHWAERIQPKEYFNTLEQFGNLTLASYPVTLAYHYPTIMSEFLVLAAVGVGYHQTALLFRR